MGLYISDAWRVYRENWKMLAAVSFVILTVSMLSLAVPRPARGLYNAFAGFVSMLGTIYAYQKIMGNYRGLKSAVVQAIWAWLASAVVGIAIVILLLLVVVLSFIGRVAGAAIGILIFLIALAFLARFIYINYLAAKGYGFDEILKRAWRADLGITWRAVLGMSIAGLLVGILTITTLTPAVVAAIKAVGAAKGIQTIGSAILHALAGGLAVVSLIAGLAVYVILVPWTWMFPIVSGRDAVGE